MRVVLLNPRRSGVLQTHRYGVGHLGLGYVAACLLQKGHDVRVIDAQTEFLHRPVVVQRIRDYAPSMLGVTAMTHEIHEAARICAAVKALLPRCVTVVGGPHATALPERTLREFPCIDAAVIGEGELTACELAEAVDSAAKRSRWSSIAGIAYRDGNETHRTRARPFLADLSAIPFPAWHLFPPQAQWPVYAGRGCPFRCAFCQRVLGGKIRLRTVDSVLAEFDAMERQLNRKGTWFQDETFGVNRAWTGRFLDRLIRRNREKGYVWRWKANSHVNLADGRLYRKMRQAGCYGLDFGVESGCQRMLERIHKNISLQQARRAIALAKEAGLRTTAFFIIGHPGETWETALQTVRFAPRSGADNIAVGVMVPYPGTEIWQLAQAGRFGYRLLSEDWRLYDKYFGGSLELARLSRRQLEFLQALTYLSFHLGRKRFKALGKMLGRFRQEAFHMTKRMLRLA